MTPKEQMISILLDMIFSGEIPESDNYVLISIIYKSKVRIVRSRYGIGPFYFHTRMDPQIELFEAMEIPEAIDFIKRYIDEEKEVTIGHGGWRSHLYYDIEGETK